MRQPDNLPAFCRVHRNGRPLIGRRARGPPPAALADQPDLYASRAAPPHRVGRADRRLRAHTDTTDGATLRDCLTALAHVLRQDHPELAHTRAAADVQVPCCGRDGWRVGIGQCR